MLCCTAALYFSWAVIIPFGRAPDEVLRFDVVHFIVRYHALPVAGDPRLLYDGNGATYAAMPDFSYILSAGLCLFVVKLLGIPAPLYLVSRMISVASGVAAVYFVCRIARKLFPHSDARFFLPVFFAFIPQFSFICSYTNQDAFMVMLSAATIDLWLLGARNGWQTRTVILLSIVTGLMLMTYLNGYILVLATLIFMLCTYKEKTSPVFLRKLLIAVGIILLVSGWFFIRNAALYHGDLLGLRVTAGIQEVKAIPGHRPSQVAPITYLKHGLGSLLVGTDFVGTAFISYWADFENMNITLNPYYYLYILVLCVLAFVGLSGAFMKKKCREGLRALVSNPFVLALLVTAAGAFALVVYYSLFGDYQPQGRYAFPGLVATVILLVYGFENFFTGRGKAMFYKFVACTFVLLNIWSVYISLFEHYYIG